jgi:plasmid stabilization system protein ParE
VNIVVAPQPAADLKRLHAFLAAESPSAAARAGERLVTTIRSLELFPERGHTSPIVGVRELVVPFGRSGYVLRYAHLPESETILVLRIWHGREDRPDER